MKKTFLVIAFLTIRIGFSQCDINPNIQVNYELDAKILALREILNDPSDPDYDNPFLPNARIVPYLEKLSAIYENPNNNPVLDSLFNEFDIHVNEAMMDPIAFKGLSFMVDTSVPWVDDLKNTGVSGIPALDNLMATYGFSVSYFFDLPSSCACTVFSLTTNFDFLNIQAIVDDFSAIADIDSPTPDYPWDRMNYTGIPYQIDGWFSEIQASDIRVEGNIFTFGIYGGDCPAGCQLKKLWNVEVDDNCIVTFLSIPETSFTEFSLYPNPVSEKLYIEGLGSGINSIRIYSVEGKLVLKSLPKPTGFDVSHLASGMYFISFLNKNGEIATANFIKK